MVLGVVAMSGPLITQVTGFLGSEAQIRAVHCVRLAGIQTTCLFSAFSWLREELP